MNDIPWAMSPLYDGFAVLFNKERKVGVGKWDGTSLNMYFLELPDSMLSYCPYGQEFVAVTATSVFVLRVNKDCFVACLKTGFNQDLKAKDKGWKVFVQDHSYERNLRQLLEELEVQWSPWPGYQSKEGKTVHHWGKLSWGSKKLNHVMTLEDKRYFHSMEMYSSTADVFGNDGKGEKIHLEEGSSLPPGEKRVLKHGLLAIQHERMVRVFRKDRLIFRHASTYAPLEGRMIDVWPDRGVLTFDSEREMFHHYGCCTSSAFPARYFGTTRLGAPVLKRDEIIYFLPVSPQTTTGARPLDAYMNGGLKISIRADMPQSHHCIFAQEFFDGTRFAVQTIEQTHYVHNFCVRKLS